MQDAVKALRLVRAEFRTQQSEHQHKLAQTRGEKDALEDAVRKLQAQLQKVSLKLVEDLPKLQEQLKRQRAESADLQAEQSKLRERNAALQSANDKIPELVKQHEALAADAKAGSMFPNKEPGSAGSSSWLLPVFFAPPLLLCSSSSS